MALNDRLKKTRKPPNLRTGTARKRCGLCKHFSPPRGTGGGVCRLYNYKVRENDVCDSFSPIRTGR